MPVHFLHGRENERKLLPMSERHPTSAVVTVLFADIVSSTEIAEEMGNQRWRELLSRFHALARKEVSHFGGHEVDTAGDGFLATFPRPADALRCACALVEAVRALGIEVRAGAHAGEVQVARGKVSGVAVHIGARVMAAAGPGQVIASRTVRELATGTGFEFDDLGERALKGVAEPWALFSVVAADSRPLSPPAPADAARALRDRIQPQHIRASRPLALGALVIAALGIGLAVVLASGGSGARGTRTPSPTGIPKIAVSINSVLRMNATTSTVTKDIVVGKAPGAVAFSGGLLWVVNTGDSTISRIDPQTNEVISTQGGLTGPCDLAADPGGGVWVTNCLARPFVVAHLSKAGDIDQTIDVPDVPAGAAFGAGDLWVALLPQSGADRAIGTGAPVDHPPGTILRIDPASGRVLHSFRVGRGAEYLAFDEGAVGGGALWVGNADDGTVSKIDAQTNLVEATIPLGGGNYWVAVGGGFVWVSGAAGTYEIDPVQNSVKGIVQRVRGSMAAVGDFLWVIDQDSPYLWKVDMRSASVAATFDLPYGAVLTAGLGDLWISAPVGFGDPCCS